MRPDKIFFLILLLAAGPVGAEIFRWTDADGNVQYGQHPPAGADATHIRAKPAPKSAPAAKPLQQQMDELDARLEAKRQHEAEAASKQQDDERRQLNCSNARNNVEQLSYGGNRMVRMPDGSHARLDEPRRLAELEKYRKAVEEYCD
jgi:hypothetical protein